MNELTRFYLAIKDDNRIGLSHVTLYMALFQCYNLNKFCNPVEINRASVMELAKISGIATFHKCIKDLNNFGYIKYEPSYNPAVPSIVHLLNIYDAP